MNLGVQGCCRCALGGILSVFATPNWLNGLEKNVTRAYIDKLKLESHLK